MKKNKFAMYWIDVLNHFEQKQYIYNGLTIPFLIGSSEIIQPESPALSVSAILQEINHSETPITVMKCRNIGEYVFGIMDSETASYPNMKSLYRHFGNLFITDNSFQNCKSFNDIIEIFINEYFDLVRQKQYSISDGEWQYFSDIDLDRLKEIVR